MKKIKASTLVESLTAMILVMIALAVFTTVYVNIMKSSDTYRRVKASILLDKIIMETKDRRMFIDENYTVGQFSIQKKITPYDRASDLRVLSFKIIDKTEKVLAERDELIIIE